MGCSLSSNKSIAFHHIALSVTDMDRATWFYSEVLGLEPIERPPFDFGGAWYQLGEHTLHLIVHPPTKSADCDALAELLRCWNGSFQQRDAWPALLAAAGLRLDDVEDLTAIAAQDFDALLAAASSGQLAGVSREEQRGWELGSHLSRSGHLGTMRLTATRSA